MIPIACLVIGAVVLIIIVYALSVRALFAIFMYQELGKGYETTEHPEHEAWAKERGIEQAKERAAERVAALFYCFPYLLVEALLFGADEGSP